MRGIWDTYFHMLGIILAVLSRIVYEASSSIGKWEISHKKESVYSMGFLNMVWGLVVITALTLLIPKDFFAPGFPGGFVFSSESLPTLLARLPLEIAQGYAAVHALALADRSTYGFLRILTIPALLIVDISLGYSVGATQMAGMALIIASLILLFVTHGIKRKGAGLVIFTALNAVATLSLFKYNVTHFNSAETEQIISFAVLIPFFYYMAIRTSKENPLQLFFRPIFLAQSSTMGLSNVLSAFAYALGIPSVITAAERALSVLFSILSGRTYFHEKNLWIKLCSFGIIATGIYLLVL